MKCLTLYLLFFLLSNTGKSEIFFHGQKFVSDSPVTFRKVPTGGFYFKDPKKSDYPEKLKQLKSDVKTRMQKELKDYPEDKAEILGLYKKEYAKKLKELKEGRKDSTIGAEAIWPMPAISIDAPIGFGSSSKTIHGGFGYLQESPTGAGDGHYFFGMGFGNPNKIAGSLTLVSSSLYTGRPPTKSFGFGSGGISIELNRILPDQSSISIGVDHLLYLDITEPLPGEPDVADYIRSIYLSWSKIFVLQRDIPILNSIGFTFGIGNKAYQGYSKFLAQKSGIGIFSALAIRVANPVTIILETRSEQVNAGVSVTPFPWVPATFTISKNKAFSTDVKAGTVQIQGTFSYSPKWGWFN